MGLGRQRHERGRGIDPLALAALGSGQVRGGAHLEELVEVGRDDAQVAQALEQGHVGAHGPVENALIEAQDAVVTVQEHGHTRHGDGY